MPRCLVRYSLIVCAGDLQNRYGPRECEGVALEEREPDEWGDPGPLVWRQWRRVVSRQGVDIAARVGTHYRIEQLERIGALEWSEGV